MAILSPSECEMLRRVAAANEQNNGLGHFVMSGAGVTAARRLERFGLVVQTKRLLGRRGSAYYRVTDAGRTALSPARVA
jgi:hypothetical protein